MYTVHRTPICNIVVTRKFFSSSDGHKQQPFFLVDSTTIQWRKGRIVKHSPWRIVTAAVYDDQWPRTFSNMHHSSWRLLPVDVYIHTHTPNIYNVHYSIKNKSYVITHAPCKFRRIRVSYSCAPAGARNTTIQVTISPRRFYCPRTRSKSVGQ